MFSITFNTAFIQNNKLVFYKRDLDRAHLDTEHKHFHMNFKIEIYFKDFEVWFILIMHLLTIFQF